MQAGTESAIALKERHRPVSSGIAPRERNQPKEGREHQRGSPERPSLPRASKESCLVARAAAGEVCRASSTPPSFLTHSSRVPSSLTRFLCFVPILWSSHCVGPFSHISQWLQKIAPSSFIVDSNNILARVSLEPKSSKEKGERKRRGSERNEKERRQARREEHGGQESTESKECAVHMVQSCRERRYLPSTGPSMQKGQYRTAEGPPSNHR